MVAMISRKIRPRTVVEYINTAPKEARKKLREMRACIREAAPGATEGLKWGIPAYSHKRLLVAFAGYKQHVGFYPTPAAVKEFADELAGFVTSDAAIQFPLDKPLPLALVRKITAFRVSESMKKDAKWRT